MQTASFLAGMNVEGEDIREFPDKVVEILRPTPIKWLRVHSLRTRALEEKTPSGATYLDGIEHLARSGYNILAAIEVGYARNVGYVAIEDLDRFVEESYRESLSSCKKISEVVRRHGRELMFGIENEIDPKAWILQALPGVEWRGRFETWARLAVDFELKYKRLNNILRGAIEADPQAKTMTNIVAEDVRVFLSDLRAELTKYSSLVRKASLSIDELVDRAVDWRLELKYLKDHLAVDYIGLDNYPNWILKAPIYGQETGGKVREAVALTERPVFNAEFGYTTYRTFLEKFLFTILRRPSASQMQLQFFQNSLMSIEQSPSVGTFPWVLITHPDRPATPEQEAYFGLTKMERGGEVRKEPTFDYYSEWLRRVTGTNPA